jgi:creatinine amidohydrolase
MSVLFQELTSPQIARALEQRAVLLLPLGQTEQHGPHLQTGCDNIIAERVAIATAEALAGAPPALVLPTIPYGYNPRSVQMWPGVFRIGWETMIRYLADVCTSAVEMGFARLIILSTHGPHADVARMAARDVFDRTGVPIVVSLPHKVVADRFAKLRRSPAGGCSHAGEYETSLLLHFGYPVKLDGLDDRDRVQLCNEWVAGDFVNGSGKISWSTWGLQLSETGVYGDPSVASAETGRLTFAALVEEYCAMVRFVREQPLPEQRFPRTAGVW